MTSGAPVADAWHAIDERGYPAIIAHAAGNAPDSAARAIADGADYLEVDAWFRRSAFELRHERRFGRVPVLYEKWRLRRPTGRGFDLAALFGLTDGRAGVFLDIKNGRQDAARTIASIVAASGSPVVASSQWWGVLRHLHDAAPGIPLFYSVDCDAKLDLFLSVSRRDPRPVGVSCRASLLTESLIGEIQAQGSRVAAWTVDDLSRAAELASWGVDAIITHLPGEVRTLFTAAL